MTVYVSNAGRLQGVPGWQEAHCTELAGGMTNRTWRVTDGSRTGVLKIDDGPRSEPFNTRRAEAAIQKAAAASGLAPGVVFVADTVLMTAFQEGVVWSRTELEGAGQLERLGRRLRVLHTLPLTGRTFDATVAARRYVARLSNPGDEMVGICTAIIMNRRQPQNLSCCHNDLVAENIIATPDLMFLDWEYACDNDPLFDLATIVEHHQLAANQVDLFLDAYFDGDGARWRRQVAVQQRLYLALLWMWLAQRPDCSTQSLKDVGQRVLTSCS